MSIAKRTAKYLLKNNTNEDKMFEQLEKFNLLNGSKKHITRSVKHLSAIFSKREKVTIITPIKITHEDALQLLKKHNVSYSENVVEVAEDTSVLDGYIIYSDNQKITVTAKDRITRFANK